MAPDNDFFAKVAAMVKEDPVMAAGYLQTVSPPPEPFVELFMSSVYKAARVALCKEHGISYKDSVTADLMSINDYCWGEGVSMGSRFLQLTGKLNPLGRYPDPLYEALGKAAQEVHAYMLAQRQKKLQFSTGDCEMTFTRNEDAEPIPLQESHSLDLLLSYYCQEWQWLRRLEQASMPDVELVALNSRGVLYYPAPPEFEAVAGKLVIIPRRTIGMKMLTDFYQEASGNVAIPLAEWKSGDTGFHLMRQEGRDQENYLLDPNIGISDKYASIALHLQAELHLEGSLSEHSEPCEKGTSLRINIFDGLISVKAKYTVSAHDYRAEFMRSAVCGREGELLRLAPQECMNLRREYVPGSSAVIDGLIASAERFIKNHLRKPELAFTNCLTNADSQPSNYFASGKLNDLDRIMFGSSIYMAARLLGHPIVADLLAKAEGKLGCLEYATDAQKSYLASHTFIPATLFGLFCSQKALQSGIALTPQLFASMEDSYRAHVAWISAYHVLTYAARVRDNSTASLYLGNALANLESYPDFRDSFVTALSASKHRNLLYENLDMVQLVQKGF